VACSAAVTLADPPAIGIGFVGGALGTWSLVVVTLWAFASSAAAESGARGTVMLGVATQLTLLRGFLVSLLAGFALSPPPASRMVRWMPGLLYVVAVLSDRYDGILARRLDQVTDLGRRLDVAMDGLGLLMASVLAVRWHRLPLIYLSVGAAYYLFHAGLALRSFLGWPVYRDRIRPRRATRFFAGVQMVVCVVALLPGTGPLSPTAFASAMTLAATVAMLPTLAFFARDWLLAVGRWPSSPRDSAP
jgi:CDP-diacylglycerol--glycerol-3-phosphate 3-phosphatidyltransferase